jgi:hypothetical protein
MVTWRLAAGCGDDAAVQQDAAPQADAAPCQPIWTSAGEPGAESRIEAGASRLEPQETGLLTDP